MRPSSDYLGAILLLLCACPPQQQQMANFGASSSGASGSSSGDSSDSGSSGSGGSQEEVCGPGEFTIVDQCYHQELVSSILWPRSVVAGDFDGNVSLDLAMTCRGTSTPFGLCLLLFPTGLITKMDLDWLETGFAQVYTADFDGDETLDILVSEWGRFAVFSVVAGEFVLQTEFVHDPNVHDGADSLMFPAIPIDIDQDGRAEVVAGSSYFGIRVWRFDAQVPAWIPAGDRHSLFGCGDLQDARVTDLDGDSFPELVALGSHNNCDEGPGQSSSEWNRISLFTGNANKTDLISSGSFAAKLKAYSLDVGDFNGDQVPDIVAADSLKDMMVFLGDGVGSFDPPLPLIGFAEFTGTGPHTADFDGNGTDELIVEEENGFWRILMGLPFPGAFDLPSSVSVIRLVQDLNQDSHADIVSLAKSDGQWRLVVTLSMTD
jgi:hypothetical protein